MNGSIPVIDVAALVSGRGDPESVAAAIRRACREHGFFYISGHGVEEELALRLEELARRFFAQDLERKLAIRMELGGQAWRGYFPLGGELTSGKPDQKEGLYFGAELEETDPRVRTGTPLHGRNLFPEDIPGFRETVLAYMERLTGLGHALVRGIALSLGLAPSYFADRYTGDPLILFRIFHYPPLPAGPEEASLWSVGEHTDYGFLTIVRQDTAGGLQVKTRSGWIDAPPLPGAFLCNIGDMLDRMTGGFYRSTPHRVRNRSGRARLSFPFFFDPNWNALVAPIDPGVAIEDDRLERWDRASLHAFRGTYGEYIMEKVSRVFPVLGRDLLPRDSHRQEQESRITDKSSSGGPPLKT